MVDFPIENQEQFDQAIQKRLTKERQKWENERGADSGELEAAQEKARKLEAEIRERDARGVLSEMNVTETGRQDRIMRLIDWPENADDKSLREAFKSAYNDMPEVFPEGATVKDKGVDTSGGGDDSSGPLTEDQVKSMSPSEINSNWDRVKSFLSGERN